LTLPDRFFLPTYAMAFFLWKTIVPLDLSPVYPELPRGWLYVSGLVFVGITYGCLVLMGKKRTGAALAFFTYVALLLPVFLGLASGAQPIADRYTYISMISIFLFVGGCALWVWSASAASPGKWYQREALAIILLLLCGVSAYRTIRHLAIWNNSVSLWSHAVRYAPATQQEYERRRPYLRPHYPDAFTNLGTAYYYAGDPEKAMEQFRHILTFDTCNADAHYNLGTLEYERGDPEASKQRFERAVACDSTYAKAYYNLGIIYAKRDSTARALAMFQKAARLGMLDAQRVLGASGYRW
jgi:tetratricopeptide (TPR) repeat protein